MTDADFIQALPKTETHLHLEGAVPYELVRSLDPEKYPAAPAFYSPGFRFASFQAFDELLLAHALPWFTSAERYHDAAVAVFARHLAQNVRYVELSFHLPVTRFIQAPAREIIRAIRAAVPEGLEVRIFAGMARNDYRGPMEAVIDGLEAIDELDGVDLHGLETMPTEPWSERVWQRIRDAGKITKCHAGEFGGSERVREAIERLGATRIQHGIRAVESPEVVRLAADLGVTFDVCPISNVRLGVAPSIALHPLRELMRAGIRCTLSTDDPLVFGNTLNDEYTALANDAGYTRPELGRLAENGWQVASVDTRFRNERIDEIRDLARAE